MADTSSIEVIKEWWNLEADTAYGDLTDLPRTHYLWQPEFSQIFIVCVSESF